MARKKESSQGEIIDEIRRIRESLWNEYKGDMSKMAESGRKIAALYGMKIIGQPVLRRKKSTARKSRHKASKKSG